jgi:pilus assembly protein Flp/PilA
LKNLKQVLSSLLSDESGQDLIEYALVAGVIALGATAAISGIGTVIVGILTNIGTKLTATV